jgi:hypothetical protein
MTFTLGELKAIIRNGEMKYGWNDEETTFDISDTNGLRHVPKQFLQPSLETLARKI